MAEQDLGAFPYVVSSPLGVSYQVSKLPYAVILDHEGVLRARGIINSREHLESLFEAKRLGVKWILGGECGHMWRVLHQYMDTMNGPADFLEEPVSPITGMRFAALSMSGAMCS